MSFSPSSSLAGILAPMRIPPIMMIGSQASRCYVTQQTRRLVAVSNSVVNGTASSTRSFSSRGGDDKQNICIVGGGFGGLYTAFRLSSLPWPKEQGSPNIIMIDPNTRFLFKPLMYELVTGNAEEDEVIPTYQELLAETMVVHMKDYVDKIVVSKTHSGSLQLRSDIDVPFNWLVLASGSKSKTDIASGASEFAYTFSSLEDIHKVSSKLVQLVEQGRSSAEKPQVYIVGAGYSGVELAAALGEKYGNDLRISVINSASEVLSVGNGDERKAVLDAFQRFNIRVTKISAAEDGTVDMELESEGQEPESKTVSMVIWTAGIDTKAPDLYLAEDDSRWTDSLDANGKLVTDKYQKIQGLRNCFAVGDVAVARSPNGDVLPATAQVAFQQSDYVAWNIYSAITSRQMLPFRYQHLGNMMSLGKSSGSLALGGSFNDFTITGPLASILRRVAYSYRMPTINQNIRSILSVLSTYGPKSSR